MIVEDVNCIKVIFGTGDIQVSTGYFNHRESNTTYAHLVQFVEGVEPKTIGETYCTDDLEYTKDKPKIQLIFPVDKVESIDVVIHALNTIKNKMIEDNLDMEIIKNVNKIKNDNT